MDQAKAETQTLTRALLQNAKTASLAVTDPDQQRPYVALVNVACTKDLEPLLLISNLARHTRGLRLDPRASLLLNADHPKTGDALTALRATVSGRCEQVEDTEAMTQFLTHHPYAKSYANFGDFNLWRMCPEVIYVVGGFGRIYEFAPDALRESV